MSGRDATILIIDDDADLRGALNEQLLLEDGLQVEEAATAEEGIALAPNATLILLDVDLPDMDGVNACRRMREKGVRAPIILFTGAAREEADQVNGLGHRTDKAAQWFAAGQPLVLCRQRGRVAGKYPGLKPRRVVNAEPHY